MDTRKLEKQFVDFVTEYKQIIYKVCYIYATDSDSLNDLYQETVINLWKSFPRFRGECKASTWVYRIALNTCISFFRKSNSRPVVVPITIDLESAFADEEENVPMDVMHVFRIASISKLITAVAIMKLQEEGKLTLQDRVFGPEGILNDTIFSDIKDPRTTKITVENLLRHQGGFSIAYGDPMFCPVEIARKMQVPPPADLNTMIRFVLSRRLGFTPGSGARYSNIGYGILSKVIEKVSGEDYELYVKRHILRPAGCFDMHLGKNLYDDKLPNEVKYYEVSNAEQIQACDGSGKLVARSNGGNNIEELYGAGGWVASPAELLRFLAVIDKDPGIPDLLSDASIDYMTQEVPSAYPIGWIETTSRGEWFRSGTLAGTSALMKKQKDGYSWVFLTNTSSWKGSRFPHYIDNAVRQAMASVHSWPERDLFEMQRFDHEKLLVIR